MPNITIRPPYSNQDIHVYDFGDVVPGYVSLVYTPKIWYDKSKSVDGGTWNIFNELGIAESLILGDSEDDLWTFEEILDEICRYFNLHIVQLGYDFYIFDWETSKSGNSVTWVNILDGTTKNSTYSVVTPSLSSYADDSTQISMGECYDQIQLTDEVEEFDDVILSPFDDENLYDIMNRQHYMRELYATGQGQKARQAFAALLNGGVGTTYNEGKDSAYTRDWWFNVRGSKYWKFLLGGNNVYDQIPEDGNGHKYKQWMLAQYVDETPFASGIFSWGHGEKINNKNQQNIENITSFTDYIVINVAGNGYDENSPTSETVYDPTTGMPTGTVATHIFPSDSDLQNCGMKIEYINANDGVYSSADPSVMNYLVFSGKLQLTTAHERTGSQGFAGYENDAYNIWTKYTNEGRSGYHYVDNTVFKRKSNTYENIKTLVNSQSYWDGRCVGSDDNDDGRYYTNLFYNQEYPMYSDAPYPSVNFLAPPCAEGDISKRFKYDLVDNRSYYGTEQTGWDTIPYVDILTCTLQIGDKYCMETVQNGKKHFEWVTEEELKNMGEDGYTTLTDGTTLYKAFIYLAVNIDDGQYLIGESHDIYNNISTNMNLEKTGMAIPLPANEHLHGELRFAIVGPVNTIWKDGIYRHPTWFRHTNWTHNAVSILPHVDKIYIEKFDVTLVSDNGNQVFNDKNDIVYLSNMIRKYTKRKDDITFKFNSALTASEAAAMGVKPILAKSTVINMTTGDSVLNIVNNATSETDKPERFYVDAYWREYNTPRMVINTALKDTNSFEYLDVTQFNKLQLSFIDDKTFFVTKTERDLKNEKINVTLKERNT